MERIDTSHNSFSTIFTPLNIKFCEHPPFLNILPIKVDQSPRNLTVNLGFYKRNVKVKFHISCHQQSIIALGVIKISFAHTYLYVNYAKIINVLKPVILRKHPLVIDTRRGWCPMTG